MKLVDAQPMFKRGDFAVWLVEDIPVGTPRRAMAQTVHDALEGKVLIRKCVQSATHIALCRRSGSVAAVAWADLQPRKAVPRGRENMPAEKWGAHRDQDGVCLVCAADDSMWCDTVEHDQHAARTLAHAYDSTLISKATAAEVFQIDGAPKLRAQTEDTRVFVKSAPYTPLDVKIAVYNAVCPQPNDRALTATMSAALEERRPKPSDAARSAWSRELRRLVAASAERERNRVVVDREVEDWE